MTFTCPVCGYDKMEDPPENHEICPCCTTHFNYDDYNTSHAELRKRWISKGKKFRVVQFKPENWNPSRQLKNIGVEL
jgi:hypothetical protein